MLLSYLTPQDCETTNVLAFAHTCICVGTHVCAVPGAHVRTRGDQKTTFSVVLKEPLVL